MIAKITHGRSASLALAYDHGPGRADEHVNPRRVAGNIAGREWRVRAHTMQRFVNAHQDHRAPSPGAERGDGGRGDVSRNRNGMSGERNGKSGERGVYRIALANPNSDRVLSDREWRQIADTFVTRFAGKDGADMGPWEATRHDRHHIHLTICKYGYDGSRISESHDYRRVAQICRDLEREHGLSNAAARTGRGSGRVRADIEHAARAVERGEPGKDRDWLRSTVGRVLAGGGGLTALREAGVSVKLNQASTGRVAGISYSRTPEPGATPGADESGSDAVIWFKGSQLGKAYSWNQVREHLGEQPPPAPDRPAPAAGDIGDGGREGGRSEDAARRAAALEQAHQRQNERLRRREQRDRGHGRDDAERGR